MIKNVLFDLDGTIIDSSRCIFTVYERLFSELGLTLPPREEFYRLIGPPVETTLRRFIDGDVTSACRRFREIYKTVDLMATNDLYDGIASEIEKVVNGGRKAFLATSKGEPTARAIIDGKGLSDLFAGVYGSRSELNRCRKSEVIDALISDFDLRREECLLVGDTLYDVEGAEESGIRVAVVGYGFGKKEDFNGKDVLFFAERTTDIAARIEECD